MSDKSRERGKVDDSEADSILKLAIEVASRDLAQSPADLVRDLKGALDDDRVLTRLATLINDENLPESLRSEYSKMVEEWKRTLDDQGDRE